MTDAPPPSRLARLKIRYDNNGNLTAFNSSTYTWGARNQLSASSAGAASFSYDPFNRRVGATVNGITRTDFYDGLNPAAKSGNVMLSGGGLDEVYGQIAADGVTSYLIDGINSTVAEVDGAGAVTANYGYSPYGDTSKNGTGTAGLQFTGRENDGATGLYYYRARYYSPQLARFVSEDPVGLVGGTNFYAYADGNPISNVDPLGLWTWQMGLSFSYSVTVAGIGFGGTASIGFAVDGHGNIASYGYYGGGGALGTPGASGGVNAAVSTGGTVCDLEGPFKNVSLGGGWGPDATGDAFWGAGSHGQLVQGAGLTLGVGVGASAFSGQTNTVLGPIGHLW